MNKYILISIKESNKPNKKLVALFENKQTKRTKQVHFGSKGMSDYTIHKDNDRKERYIKRHKPRENWDNPITAGALSRWVLWNKKTVKSSIKDYQNRFKL